MKFLEIKEGFSVNIDKIEAIERKDDFSSVIHTHFNSHTANFPYITLLRILEGEVEKPVENERVIKKLEGVLNHAQHWAG